MATKIPIDTQELAVNVLRQVDGMRTDKKHCDFLIKVGSEEIPVHRNILSANSDYFSAMFSYPTKENKSGIVEMVGVDTECAIICVDHMYGKPVSVLPAKYEPLMFVANMMQLHKLRDAIGLLLEANLNPKSFSAARRIATMHACKNLEQKCEEFAEENLGLITKEEEFGGLDKSFIKKMIKSKNVKISEEQKLCSFLEWIGNDSERRRNTMGEFLGCVDLMKIPVAYLRFVAENEPLISGNFSFFKIFCASIFDSARIGSRKASFKSEAKSGILVFDGITNHLQLFNPRDHNWKRMHEMTVDMKWLTFSAIAFGDNLYVLMKSKSVYRLLYSDERAAWERMADMLEEHGSAPRAAVWEGCIYVFGGHQIPSRKCIEKYDPAKNKWSKLPDKPQPFRGSTVLTSGKDIYLFGGTVSEVWVNRAERFNPMSLLWTEVTPMRKVRGYAAAVKVDGRIYIIGGLCNGSHIQSLECYDISDDKWTTLTPMKTARCHLRAVAADGCVYAVGGEGGRHCIEKYTVQKDEWEELQLPSGMELDILESTEIILPQ